MARVGQKDQLNCKKLFTICFHDTNCENSLQLFFLNALRVNEIRIVWIGLQRKLPCCAGTAVTATTTRQKMKTVFFIAGEGAHTGLFYWKQESFSIKL